MIAWHIFYCACTWMTYQTASVVAGEIVSVHQSNHQSASLHHHHLRHIIRSELQMLKSDSVSKFKKFHVTTISNTSLITILDNLDEKSTRYFMIKVNGIQSIDTALLSCLDSVIISRLWFTIRRISAVDSQGTAPSLDFILIERAPDHVNGPLRLIAEKNFPGSQNQCREHPLSATLLMGTWGNDGRNIVQYLNGRPQYVTYFFSSRTGSVNDATSYNEEGECLDKVNKYECLFLPSTNCKLPKSLDILSKPIEDNYIYDQADPQGKLLEGHVNQFNDGIFKTKRKFEVKSLGLTSTYDYYGIGGKHSYYFTGYAPDIILGHTVIPKKALLETRFYGDIINIFGYAFRVNAAFRLKIQHYVDHFRATSQPSFYHNTSCVWLHARKDDRMLPPTEWNMLEWCRNFTHYNAANVAYETIPGDFKIYKNSTSTEVANMGTILNYGCQLTLPYGAATLEHFINASLILSPHTKNLFLSTDDEAWLTKAVSEYRVRPNNLIDKLQLQINHFNPPSTHRQVHSMDNAAQLFATMELGQQCDGFVGYAAGSAIAQLFFQSMCYRRNSKYLSCPPLFDLGTEGKLPKS